MASIRFDAPVIHAKFNPVAPQLVVVSSRQGEVTTMDCTDPASVKTQWRRSWPGKDAFFQRPRTLEAIRRALEIRNGRLIHRGCSFSFDLSGTRIALVGPDSPVDNIDAPTGRVLLSVGEDGQFSNAVFDDSGSRVYALGCVTERITRAGTHTSHGFDFHAAIFDLASGNQLAAASNTFSGGITRHPTLPLMVKATPSQGSSSICFFRSDELAELPRQLVDLESVKAPRFTPSGDRLAYVIVEDVFGVAVLDFPACSVRWSRFWRVQDRTGPQYAVPRACVFSADSASLYVPSPTGEILEFDADNGTELRRWIAHAGDVHTLDRDATGKYLVSCGVDGEVKLWEVGDGGKPTIPPQQPFTEEELLDRLGWSADEEPIYLKHPKAAFAELRGE